MIFLPLVRHTFDSSTQHTTYRDKTPNLTLRSVVEILQRDETNEYKYRQGYSDRWQQKLITLSK